MKSVLEQLTEEIVKLTRQYKPHAKYRRCLRCQEPFKPVRDDHVWCSSSCGRAAHTLRFNVRAIRRGLHEKAKK
ncbi:MAG TPA: hypothetical protein VIV56_16860 [Gemmatimonadales bacterium]